MPKPDNWHNEDGFEFALLPAKSGKAKSLIVVLHGHGSNTDNWEAQSKQMRDDIPDADIITVQGPIRMPQGLEPGVEGYSWLPYEGAPLRDKAKHSLSLVFNTLPVADKLNSFLDKQLEKRGLTVDDLGLVGSSMGGIVVLQAALNRRKPVAGVVSHSGALLPFTKVNSKPDILLIMGGKDDVFHKPPEPKKGLLKRAFAAVSKRFALQHKDTLRRFRKKKIPFTEKFYPGMAHETTDQSVAAGNAFLSKALRKHKAQPKPD